MWHTKRPIQQLIKLQKIVDMSIGVGPTVGGLEELPYAFNGAKTTLAFSNEHGHATYFEEAAVSVGHRKIAALKTGPYQRQLLSFEIHPRFHYNSINRKY